MRFIKNLAKSLKNSLSKKPTAPAAKKPKELHLEAYHTPNEEFVGPHCNRMEDAPFPMTQESVTKAAVDNSLGR